MKLFRSAISKVLIAAALGLLVAWGGLHMLNDCRHKTNNSIIKNGRTNNVISSEGTFEGNIDNPLPDAEADIEHPQREGYYIYINLEQLNLYLYKDGQLINTYPVSGGKARTPSPVGIWKIVNKDDWGEGFGGAWMELNVPWGCYGIHGTLEPWYVGKSHQSKGCIRMRSKDAQELYRIVPYGTVVNIQYPNRPYRLIQSGDVGSDIVEVERALKKMDYYSGSIDGVFGQGLKDSVIKFQKENNLSVTGAVNKQTYDTIMNKYNEAE